MIKISKSKEELKNLQKEFFDFVNDRIKQPSQEDVKNEKLQELCTWFKSHYDFFANLGKDKMQGIINLLNLLAEQNQDFQREFSKFEVGLSNIPDDLMNKVSAMKESKSFSTWAKEEYNRIFKLVKKGQPLGYWLSTSLDVKVCPYCNRAYTFTATRKNKKPLVRPQFDHFFDKATHPYFALSFWNFIPSCPTCNHVKGNKELKVYPYEEDFGAKKFKIPIDAQLNPQNDFRVEFKGENEDADHDIQVLGLEELYKQHNDYSREIYWKAQAYNEDYYASLETSLGSQLGLSKTEMNRIIFGNYTSEGDLGKRPLAKLTKELLEQFDVKL